jgi:hypothetical protein
VVKPLGKGITLGPPPLDPEVVKAAAETLDRKEMASLGRGARGSERLKRRTQAAPFVADACIAYNDGILIRDSACRL